ncbi:MAG: hypothetical protein ACPGGK_09700 [Pikeienuella sp.]
MKHTACAYLQAAALVAGVAIGGAVFGLSSAALAGNAVDAETRHVYLQNAAGERIEIATLAVTADGKYDVSMRDEEFADHFLSMRPFKCLEGSEKTWCHVPYPYEIKRDISEELTDLEYDFLFLWKGKTEYGINMWNGIYFQIEQKNGVLHGTLHEMDMDLLSAPPDAGVLRPLREQDIHESDPDSHWLPLMIIE